MYKILLISVITVFFISGAKAQEIYDNVNSSAESIINNQFAPSEEADNPDEAGTAMPNIGISEEKHIVEVVEGVGHIPYNSMAFRAAPSLKSRVVRYSSGAEKVILIGESGDWYKVIMYNNNEAYIQKKYVRTTKLFMDETLTKNRMNKTVSIELEYLLDKFDKTIESSSFTKKNQVRPILELIEAKNIKNDVTLVFYYACVDLDGKPIPSYNSNRLYAHMQQLLDLILGRLVLTNAERFNIVIKIPSYDESGNVVNFDKEYANIVLIPDKVDIEKVRKENISILSLAECSIPIEDLFKIFPK